MKDFIEYLENNPYRGNQEACGSGKALYPEDRGCRPAHGAG